MLGGTRSCAEKSQTVMKEYLFTGQSGKETFEQRYVDVWGRKAFQARKCLIKVNANALKQEEGSVMRLERLGSHDKKTKPE